jgi:hypothetical protein
MVKNADRDPPGKFFEYEFILWMDRCSCCADEVGGSGKNMKNKR